jgi:hypothetical protein
MKERKDALHTGWEEEGQKQELPQLWNDAATAGPVMRFHSSGEQQKVED